ncbi:MAG: hypothetical protein AAFP19_20250, partial [Bacteroidota bacterium]
MQVLQELVQVINRFKVRRINVIGNSKDRKSKIEQFYDALVEEKFTNDEEASLFFYKDSEQNTNYKKLKGGLRER